jgi:hypothetical protein
MAVVGTAGAYREIDTLGGHEPYSSSKACSEFAVECWRLSFFHAQGPQSSRNRKPSRKPGISVPPTARCEV